MFFFIKKFTKTYWYNNRTDGPNNRLKVYYSLLVRSLKNLNWNKSP